MAEAFDSFVDKWLQQHPEMQWLEPFCLPAERRLFRAWGALTHELSEAMFATTDPGVARTKLAWWGEDLAAGVGGVRHPVGRVLLAEPRAEQLSAESWRPLITAAIDLSQAARFAAQPLPPEDEALAFAGRLAEIERRLFARDSAAEAVAASLRAGCWLPSLTDDRPEHVAETAAELLAGLPRLAGLCLFRSGRIAFDRWRLERLQSGAAPRTVRQVPPVRALFVAWSAARRSRR